MPRSRSQSVLLHSFYSSSNGALFHRSSSSHTPHSSTMWLQHHPMAQHRSLRLKNNEREARKSHKKATELSIQLSSPRLIDSLLLLCSHTKCKVWWALIGSSIEPLFGENYWECLWGGRASVVHWITERFLQFLATMFTMLSRPIVGWRFHDNSPARKSVYWDISSEKKSACGLPQFRHILAAVLKTITSHTSECVIWHDFITGTLEKFISKLIFDLCRSIIHSINDNFDRKSNLSCGSITLQLHSNLRAWEGRSWEEKMCAYKLKRALLHFSFAIGKKAVKGGKNIGQTRSWKIAIDSNVREWSTIVGSVVFRLSAAWMR